MKIAFHRVKITPSEPSYLCGHAMRVHQHDGVLDDIYISLLRIQTPCDDYLFGSVDLVGLDQELIARMQELGVMAGIPADHIIISVIHTHAAPEFSDVNLFSGDPATGARPGYRDFLVKQFEEALKGCQTWQEVDVAYASTLIDGYYGNRNNIMYPSDKSANFLLFKKQGKPLYMIGNISCHPTVLGPQNYKISADLFGAIRLDLETYYDVPVMMWNGAQGDVSNRQYRQGNDEVELVRMSQGICMQLHNLEFKDMKAEPITCKDITYIIDYMSNPANIDEKIKKAKQILETEVNPDILKVTKSGIAFMEMNKTLDPHVHEEIKTRVIQLGDVIIVTVGGELFSKFALDIKAAFPNQKIIIWGITDHSTGYLVEEAEYGKNYESMTTRIPKGEVEKYAQHIITTIQSLQS